MTRFLLIRHGESEANRQRVFAGQLDAPLLDKGIEQAEKTAEYIAENYTVDAVYASDLKRAYKTGEIVAKRCGCKIFSDTRLREIYAGAWQGEHFEDIARAFETDYSVWLTDIGNCRTTEGEAVKALQERVLLALSDIAKAHPDCTIVIATHATPIRALECVLQGKSLDCMKDIPWVSNASMTEVLYDGTWQTVKIGYDEHLKDLVTAFSKGV